VPAFIDDPRYDLPYSTLRAREAVPNETETGMIEKRDAASGGREIN